MDKLQKIIDELSSDSSVLILSPNRDIYRLISSKIKNVDTVFNLNSCYDLVVLENNLAQGTDLDALWNSLNYNAFLYLDNFKLGLYDSIGRKLNTFIASHTKELVTSRQMVVNSSTPHITENFLIVKCFPKSKQIQFDAQTQTKPLIIATVLRSGGIYNESYVNRLANAVAANLTVPYTFVCLTDVDHTGFNPNVHKSIKFAQNYPKWWGKVELFRKNIFAGHKVVYFDLDTLIIKNIDFVVNYTGSFCGLRDFYHMVSLGSGVMAWDGDNDRLSDIYMDFVPKSKSIMTNYPAGDQQWINEKAKHYLTYIQDYFPKKIVSFKKDCYTPAHKATPAIINYPDDAAIVCFHGSPRMHELNDHPQIQPYWFD